MTTAQIIGWLGVVGLTGCVCFVCGALWALRDDRHADSGLHGEN